MKDSCSIITEHDLKFIIDKEAFTVPDMTFVCNVKKIRKNVVDSGKQFIQ